MLKAIFAGVAVLVLARGCTAQGTGLGGTGIFDTGGGANSTVVNGVTTIVGIFSVGIEGHASILMEATVGIEDQSVQKFNARYTLNNGAALNTSCTIDLSANTSSFETLPNGVIHVNISVPIFGHTASLLFFNTSTSSVGTYYVNVVVEPPCDDACQALPFPCYFPPPAIPPPSPGVAPVQSYVASTPGSAPGIIQNILQVLPKFGETTPQYWLMESAVTPTGISSLSLRLCDAQGNPAPDVPNFSPWYAVIPNGTNYLYSTLPTRETVYQVGVIDSANNVQAWGSAVDSTLKTIMQPFPGPQYSTGPAYYMMSGSTYTVSAQLYFPSDMSVQTFVFNTSAPYDAASTKLFVEDDTGAPTPTSVSFTVTASTATISSTADEATPVQFITFTMPYGGDTMTIKINNATNSGYFQVADSTGALVLPTKESVATDAKAPPPSAGGSTPPPSGSKPLSAGASVALLIAATLLVLSFRHELARVGGARCGKNTQKINDGTK